MKTITFKSRHQVDLFNQIARRLQFRDPAVGVGDIVHFKPVENREEIAKQANMGFPSCAVWFENNETKYYPMRLDHMASNASRFLPDTATVILFPEPYTSDEFDSNVHISLYRHIRLGTLRDELPLVANTRPVMLSM